MRRITLAPQAREAFKEILRHSRRRFGPEARHRYRLLLEQAFRDLAIEPERAGVRTTPAGDPRIRLYPIRHSRGRLPIRERVASPSHALAFRFDDKRIEILHILHEQMDLPKRLG